MTMQEYFDKTVAHLRTLKGRAMVPDEAGYPACAYLTGDGRKCAIGVHIPDGHPGQSFIGGVDELLQDYPDLEGVVVLHHEDGRFLARDLQSAHDREGNWDGDTFIAEDRLSKTARFFNLKYTPPGAE